MMRPMISVKSFTKRFGQTVAVDNVSFEVGEGEVFVLLGPNGSGKTTTLKAIVGLNIPSSGRILVNGLDTGTHPKESRRSLSYLPQQVVFPDTLTAAEILRFYCRLRDLPARCVREALDRTRLNGFPDKPVAEFSGGMIQRLGLAVVALPDAPILVLDEPTANLDPQGVKRFREFVTSQKDRGKTIVFSTHLLAEAEQLASRVAIFVSGRLVAQESVEGLKSAFEATRTIEDMYLHYVEHYAAE